MKWFPLISLVSKFLNMKKMVAESIVLSVEYCGKKLFFYEIGYTIILFLMSTFWFSILWFDNEKHSVNFLSNYMYNYLLFQVEKLSKRNLRRLVTSRLSLLKNKRFLNIEELEAHSENVVSCIFYLQLQVTGNFYNSLNILDLGFCQ